MLKNTDALLRALYTQPKLFNQAANPDRVKNESEPGSTESPKTSEEANILEISLEAYSFNHGVYQDFFTTPKTFKMRIDKYARV